MKQNRVVELFKEFMDKPLLFGVVISLFFMGIIKLLAYLMGFLVKPLHLGAYADTVLELILMIIFVGLYIWFRIGYKKEIPHTLSAKTFFKGLLLLLPMLVMAAGLFGFSMIQVFAGMRKLPDGAYILRAFISALEAGVCEDIAIRGLFAGNAMRVKHTEKDIVKYAVLSSVAFGLVHFLNLASGASVAETVSQVVYAMGYGLILCAAFYRTGTVLPCIVAHFLFDFFEMMSMAINNGQQEQIGMMEGAGANPAVGFLKIGLGIVTLLVFGGIGLFYLRKKHHESILRIFSVEEEMPHENESETPVIE